MTLEYCLADTPSRAGHHDGGWAALEESLLLHVDDDGMLREAQLEHWFPLLACWTRCLMLGAVRGQTLKDDSGSRYQELVESLLRLTRKNGLILFTSEAEMPAIRQLDLWRAAAQFVDLRLRKAMSAIWGTAVISGRPSGARAKPAELPPPSANSERAGLAVLRPRWAAPRLAIDYRGTELRIELEREGDVYFSGPCNPQVAIDGRRLTPQSPWEEICWITDDDVDYLELQLTLSESVAVQRHFIFAREDEFIFLADAVLGDRTAAIEYQMALPFAANASIEHARETRELALVKGGRRRAVILPLALSEWQSDRRWGELAVEAGILQLAQSAAQARNLFAPWFIDLAPRRLRRPVTWRRLSVAEDRQIQPHDAAVGYRVRVGGGQWLFYRSLAVCGNRTVLGHNLVSEFLAARFDRRGVAETLIEIEAPADDDE